MSKPPAISAPVRSASGLRQRSATPADQGPQCDGSAQYPAPSIPATVLDQPVKRLATARAQATLGAARHMEIPAGRRFGTWLNRPRRVLLTLAAV
ncbi:MAG: hypothetical protein KAY37_11350 [Phycisphaerae bacterium]|nr:hypothetical protein [Phycisphaerae bacterium]